MRQLLILSGKGGTGKTTLASSFIHLSDAKAYADCDVDAPNLHLIKRTYHEVEHQDYMGMDKMVIDPNQCISCGKCMTHCRFGAISKVNGYEVSTRACEGCGVCAYVCPVQAIQSQKIKAGDLSLFKGDSFFSTAKLVMGSGTSGLLVTEVKKQLKACPIESELIIIDGSPGIGCPVIASISGVDMILMVAEPSVSGLSDLKRIVDTAKIFKPKLAVCVNKFDTNDALTSDIISYCEQEDIDFVGKIPFDNEVGAAVNKGLSIVSGDGKAAEAVKRVYDNTISILNNKIWRFV